MSKVLPDNEILLLHKASKGDEEAFARVFHAYKDKLFGFILKITHSKEAAEDVVQEVFLKIWMQKEDLSRIENFNAFLFRSAHNQAINLLRRTAKEALILKDKQIQNKGTLPTPNDDLYYKDLCQIIDQIVERLPSQQKLIFRMSREGNLKQKEIAGKLNLSLSTV